MNKDVQKTQREAKEGVIETSMGEACSNELVL